MDFLVFLGTIFLGSYFTPDIDGFAISSGSFGPITQIGSLVPIGTLGSSGSPKGLWGPRGAQDLPSSMYIAPLIKDTPFFCLFDGVYI